MAVPFHSDSPFPLPIYTQLKSHSSQDLNVSFNKTQSSKIKPQLSRRKMSLPSESDTTGTNTELTLALPGDSRVNSAKPSTKRSFSDAADPPEDGDSAVTNPPPRKAQVVGWPPVRGGGIKRETGKCKYVKVAVDGAPYLRKVDLEMYGSYEQLLNALMKLFHFGSEYFPTFQDKDGDWMMVGDVPWNMFVESCKRLRLMKRSEVVGLGQKTSSKCSSSGE